LIKLDFIALPEIKLSEKSGRQIHTEKIFQAIREVLVLFEMLNVCLCPGLRNWYRTGGSDCLKTAQVELKCRLKHEVAVEGLLWNNSSTRVGLVRQLRLKQSWSPQVVFVASPRPTRSWSPHQDPSGLGHLTKTQAVLVASPRPKWSWSWLPHQDCCGQNEV
jgi:hypothetical protein